MKMKMKNNMIIDKQNINTLNHNNKNNHIRNRINNNNQNYQNNSQINISKNNKISNITTIATGVNFKNFGRQIKVKLGMQQILQNQNQLNNNTNENINTVNAQNQNKKLSQLNDQKQLIKGQQNIKLYTTIIRQLNRTVSGQIYGTKYKIYTQQPMQQVNGKLSKSKSKNKNVKFNDIHMPGNVSGNLTSRSNVSNNSSSSKSILKNSSLKKDSLFRKRTNSSSSQSFNLMKGSLSMKSSKSLLKSSTGSITTTALAFGQSKPCDNFEINKSIKEKYQRILLSTKKVNRKFTDQMFPPLRTSLQSGKSLVYQSKNSITNTIFKQIKWMRISQLYKNKKTVVWSSQTQSKSKIIKSNNTNTNRKNQNKQSIFNSNHIANVFNSLKYNNTLLEKMFQDQQYCQLGIYYVKINHNNVWKYIIIDDNIPVIRDSQNGRYVHAFFQVINKSNENINQKKQNQKIQIWPYLLLKAYSKLYSNYQSVININQIQLLQDITGCKSQKIKINSQKDTNQIFSKLKTFNTSFLITDLKNQFHPVVHFYHNQKYLHQCSTIDLNEYTQQQNQNKVLQTIQIQNSLKQYSIKSFSSYDLFKNFNQFFFVELYQYSFSSIGNISKNTKEQIILRSFVIDQITQAEISVIQKDRKVYQGTNTKYQYSWIRLILVMKESAGYRFISGQYSKQKKCIVKGNFEIGQYFVIIIPQWNNQKSYDLNILYNGNSPSKFQKKYIKDHPNIITQSCMDLAQRYGTIKQINNNICSYNYIHKQLGLIIQNINNQRYRGIVKIVRSISGLTGAFPIDSLNQQFKINNTIQIDIPSLNHFTVVLRMKGGIDKQLLDMFDFGS